MDGMELGKMVGGLGEAYAKGQSLGMEKAVFPMKIGLMQQQQQIGEQQLREGQITLEEKKKLVQFGQELGEWSRSNPDANPWEYAPQLAMKYGLSQQALGFLKANTDRVDSVIKTFQSLLSVNPQKALDFVNNNKEARSMIGNMTMNDLGPQIEIITEKEIPGLGGNKIIYSKGSNKFEVIKPTEERALTEAEYMALPETDPRRQQVISGKQAIQAPKSMTEVEILSLPEGDPRKQAYIKGKKEVSTKDPYFQAVGIIEETNELIGYDTRTFQTKREKISGMPIKPGTVKAASPVAQALAEAMKKTKGKVSTESKTPKGGKTVEDTINDLKAKGTSSARIIELMSEAGIDTDQYMDLINK